MTKIGNEIKESKLLTDSKSSGNDSIINTVDVSVYTTYTVSTLKILYMA